MIIKTTKSKILDDAYKFFFLLNGIVLSLWIIEFVIVFILKSQSYACTTSLAIIDALFIAYLVCSLIINAYHLWQKEIPSFKELSIIGLLITVTALGWYLTSIYLVELDRCSYSLLTQDQLINIFTRKF